MGPAHNRFRRMLSPTFAPLRLRPLEERIQGRVCVSLDRSGARRECEFVTELAAELPVQMLAELLRLPQEDRLKLFDWSNSVIAEDDPELRKSPAASARDVRDGRVLRAPLGRSARPSGQRRH
jgi:cytochrome P450